MTITTTVAPKVDPIGESRNVQEPNPTHTIPSVLVTTQRPDYLIRRFQLVFHDLGLDRVVPDRWITSDSDGLEFKRLTLKQADGVIAALEDIALDRQVKAPSPGPDQLSLFG